MPLNSHILNSGNINVDIQPVYIVGSDANPTTSTATIAAAGNLSSAIDLQDAKLHALSLSAWTTAAVTFQVSVDGTTYLNLFDTNGEVTVASGNVATGRAIVLNKDTFEGFRYVKVRSGSSATPVAQTAGTTITVYRKS